MKKIIFMLAILSIFVSCKEKETVVSEQPKLEVYRPQHQETVVDITAPQKYVYISAPKNEAAKSVVVQYDEKVPYAQPIEIIYRYANGDTFKHVIPADFGLWKNEAGRFRVVSDKNCTVWLQGQTRKGQFHEFVFYGNPKYNGTRIEPNSYGNEIKYR